jgi:hypothetical protein
MNNKVFTAQEEAYQRSKEEAFNHKASQQVKKEDLDLQKMHFLKRFCAKRVGALV